MALDTRGLASGFGQGFGLADQYYARQHQQDLQTKQNERADRRMEMAETQFSGQQEDAQRKRSQEQAQFTLGKIAQGVELSQEEMTFLEENPQYWPALDPETDAAIENAQRVIDPDDPMGSNDPEALYSMNLMFGHRVNRGEGGKKRIAGIYPGRGEGTVAIDLEVEGEDGKKYNAPMTRNRGVAGADDEVLETDVGSLVDQVQGYRMMRNAFRAPEGQQTAAKILAALKGERTQQSAAYQKRQEMLGLGIDDEVATRNAYGLDASSKRHGEPFEHPQLGWVQPGPDGKLQQMDTQESSDKADWRKLDDGRLFNQRTGEIQEVGGGAPSDGTGGLDLSVMSQIQQTTRNFHGSFNPDGSFMGIPDGAREKYTLAMQRAQELVGAGLPVFEATNLANLSVGDKLAESEAKRLAEQEAEQEITGWFKGDERDAFVQRRKQELLSESEGAQQRYEQIVGGKGGSGDPDMQQANQVKADYHSGKITREEAVSKLRNLGLK